MDFIKFRSCFVFYNKSDFNLLTMSVELRGRDSWESIGRLDRKNLHHSGSRNTYNSVIQLSRSFLFFYFILFSKILSTYLLFEHWVNMLLWSLLCLLFTSCLEISVKVIRVKRGQVETVMVRNPRNFKTKARKWVQL